MREIVQRKIFLDDSGISFRLKFSKNVKANKSVNCLGQQNATATIGYVKATCKEMKKNINNYLNLILYGGFTSLGRSYERPYP